MMLAQQKQEVLSHFFISTYYANNSVNNECTVLVELPFSSTANGSLFYSSSGDDYQTVATIVILYIINDQEFIDFLAGNGVTPITGAYEQLQRADMFQVVMIPTEEEIALGSTYSSLLTLLVTTCSFIMIFVVSYVNTITLSNMSNY